MFISKDFYPSEGKSVFVVKVLAQFHKKNSQRWKLLPSHQWTKLLQHPPAIPQVTDTGLSFLCVSKRSL